MVYLDNASTTYPKPECVYAETMEQFRRFGVSPSRGCYSAARDMNKIVYSTRLALAKMFKTIGTFPLGTVRFSPGHFTTDEDLSALDSALKVKNETEDPVKGRIMATSHDPGLLAARLVLKQPVLIAECATAGLQMRGMGARIRVKLGVTKWLRKRRTSAKRLALPRQCHPSRNPVLR